MHSERFEPPTSRLGARSSTIAPTAPSINCCIGRTLLGIGTREWNTYSAPGKVFHAVVAASDQRISFWTYQVPTYTPGLRETTWIKFFAQGLKQNKQHHLGIQTRNFKVGSPERPLRSQIQFPWILLNTYIFKYQLIQVSAPYSPIIATRKQLPRIRWCKFEAADWLRVRFKKENSIVLIFWLLEYQNKIQRMTYSDSKPIWVLSPQNEPNLAIHSNEINRIKTQYTGHGGPVFVLFTSCFLW